MSNVKAQNQLTSFFEEHFSLQREGMEELLASFDCEMVPKGSIILASGQIEKRLKFVQRGFVRTYYADEQAERNISFYGPGEFATDFLSFRANRQTNKWQQCLTEVELQTLSKASFDRLLDKHECGQKIVEKAFRSILQCTESKSYLRLTKKPEELYRYILEHKSHWLQHIPQYHLASYLNIAPETLSRIRNRIS